MSMEKYLVVVESIDQIADRVRMVVSVTDTSVPQKTERKLEIFGSGAGLSEDWLRSQIVGEIQRFEAYETMKKIPLGVFDIINGGV